MKKIWLLLLSLPVATSLKSQSVGIGTAAPHTSALLDISTTTKGILIPRMTTLQRMALASPLNGLQVYDTDMNELYHYNGSAWVAILNSTYWRRPSLTRDIVSNISDSVGIGTNAPGAKLEVSGSDVLIHNLSVGRGGGGNSTNNVMGYLALASNTSGISNTAIGYNALRDNTIADFNTAVGYASLFNNTQGNNNTAIGYRTLYNNSIGYSNVAVGMRALYDNTSGNNLVAVGDSALYNNTSSRGNVAIGSKTLYSNTTGNNNTATGNQALRYNIDGDGNVANGLLALYNNISGSSNIALGQNAAVENTTGDRNCVIGPYALAENTTGVNNVALGYNALQTNITGSNNTAIGRDADFIFSPGVIDNCTMLGTFAIGTASNQVRIGSSSVTSIGGYAGWSNVSDGRIKTNVQKNVPGLIFINRLEPVTYQLDLTAADNIIGHKAAKNKSDLTTDSSLIRAKQEKEAMVQSGFIAQEVANAARTVGYDFSGVDPAKNERDLYGLRYAEFVVPLVKAVQELSKENDELKKRIEKLEAVVLKMQ